MGCVKETRGKGQTAFHRRLLSNEEVTKAKEATDVLGGLMKDAAGLSTDTSPPGPSTSTSSEDKESKSKNGRHIATPIRNKSATWCLALKQ